MAKRAHVTQYYADDKDVFDMFMSGKRRFTHDFLIELARQRGIVLSEEATRQEIATYLSQLLWSWPEIERLLEHGEMPERKEKLMSSVFKVDSDLDAVRTAIEDIVKLRTNLDEAYTVASNAESGMISIAIKYSDFDPTRNRLQQRVMRESAIQIERTKDGYKVRYQANEKSRDVVGNIEQELGKLDGGKKFPDAHITLAGIVAPETRTQFFVDLMQGMRGYLLKDVSMASVYRATATSDSASDADVDPDADPDADGDEGGDSATAEAATMLGVVRNAALEGESLLTSPEFRSLTVQGFFLSRTVWRSAMKGGDGTEYEIEADFEDAKECEGFRYNVRGMYEPRTRGEEGLKKTRTAVPTDRREEILRVLEETAQAALATAVRTDASADDATDDDDDADADADADARVGR